MKWEKFHFFVQRNTYSSPVIRTACQVRAANLLLLWISPALILFVVTMVLIITAMVACCKKDYCVA